MKMTRMTRRVEFRLSVLTSKYTLVETRIGTRIPWHSEGLVLQMDKIGPLQLEYRQYQCVTYLNEVQ